MLRGFGLKVGPTTPRTFESRLCELVEGHPTLVTVADALLPARAELLRQFKELEKQLVQIGRADERVRRLTTVPRVGNLVALTFVAAIDDPSRFRASRQVGAYLGLKSKGRPSPCSARGPPARLMGRDAGSAQAVDSGAASSTTTRP